MKRRLTLVTDSSQPRLVPPPEPCFWKALIAIYNKYFERELRNFYNSTSESDDHIYTQFKVIDYWIDMAIDRGWMDEDVT